ncbi:hypothetical protein PHAVU_007G235400 [Phaseolus vulgaris]|uniref:F-box domain-containing protein n=1 Tax=Phaseolus vulgaris TaxID=3885 RepID=V7BHL3_PHAVU|nr:hypothetical protein PHAVU_007G235400g [Phaseolus vulgaris]ESW17389.1 hypothetical protein PHAVU_007G235400g [Phaseolus vulgaris]
MSSSSQCSTLLPEEVMMEILSRVPVKDLVRFRCTSKWMNHLVLDRAFVKLHLQRCSKNTNILLTIGNYESNETMYCATSLSLQSFLQHPSSTIGHSHRFNRNYNVLGVCNGLVCLQDSHYGFDGQELCVRFWNPSTRLMSEDSPRLRIPSNDFGYPFQFGFGYDDWSDTYQVVLCDNKSQKMEVSVHSLGDSCWRNVLSCNALVTLSLYGAYVCGTVNWLAVPKFDYAFQWKNVSMNELIIFSYDVKNEKCNYLSVPDVDCEVTPEVPVIEVLKGCLCLNHRQGTQLRVWTMREFGVAKSWTPLLNINYEDLNIHVLHGMPTTPVILCVSENDNVLLRGSYDTAEFIMYNKKDNKILRYEVFEDNDFYCFSYDYVHSLVLPYGN